MVNIFLIDKGLKYLDHFILILNEEFDSLDGGYSEWLTWDLGELVKYLRQSIITLANVKWGNGGDLEEFTFATAAETPPTTQKHVSQLNWPSE